MNKLFTQIPSESYVLRSHYSGLNAADLMRSQTRSVCGEIRRKSSVLSPKQHVFLET